jgi:hypothetical protein
MSKRRLKAALFSLYLVLSVSESVKTSYPWPLRQVKRSSWLLRAEATPANSYGVVKEDGLFNLMVIAETPISEIRVLDDEVETLPDHQ